MGRRKSARKVVKKATAKLEVTFNCLFCNHTSSCSVKIDHDLMVAKLLCATCHVSFESDTDALTEPIDVYSSWIDACQEEQDKGSRRPAEDDFDDE